MREFDLIIQGILAQDKIGHLFVVEIKFDLKNANQKQFFFNAIYSPIFDQKKVLSANERSVFQLVDAMRLNNKGTTNSFKTTAKTHTTMDQKIAIPFYAEHLHLLLTRCGWCVTKIRAHYTFEQCKFKKDFDVMKQVACQNAQRDVEKDFYKLMNKRKLWL